MKRSKATLEQVYQEIKQVILSRQHPVTGLLPASTAVTSHGDYTDAWVRDNVYSIISVWALCLAMKRDGQKNRHDLLEQATIKLMRGLLQAMMRQADKVETFKHTLAPEDSLHAKYDTASGLTVVADDAWGHLQIDATSIYLLMLAQMSASGLRIVCTGSEVDFVQNLVYYIASAYRTPDFGIWERGNKINNGQTEINASSVGMAKAALQAMDGLNLFGPDANKRAVIHVIPDAVALARNTLGALLPRESLSKEVDSALLSIIGFPAFAVGRAELLTKTRDTILSKLGGNWGCKRFLWDGHQTVIEESTRLYYEHSELAGFEHIESEWPLFYCYLYVNALFDGLDTTAKHYRKKIESLMVQRGGIGLIPELYYLPKEYIGVEKRQPRSQSRLPNENIPLVWAQSLFYTGRLLDEGYLSNEDLDPLYIRRRSTRFTQAQIALVVLAENEQVKATLSQNGVIAESLEDIKPVAALTAPHLVDAFSRVGANEALGLTGRPKRRLQSLATSHSYKINNRTCLCLSWLQSETRDYRLYDAEFFSELLISEITHIRKHWNVPEVAVFTLKIGDELCAIPGAAILFKTLKDLQLRNTHEHVGNASASLAVRASRTTELILPDFSVLALTTQHHKISTSLEIDTDDLLPPFSSLTEAVIRDAPPCDLVHEFKSSLTQGELEQSINIDGSLSAKALLQEIARFAQQTNRWALCRLCFAYLDQGHLDLAESITLLAARHLKLAIGEDKRSEMLISSGLSNQEILDGLEQVFVDPLEQSLAQEVIVAIGSLLRTEPFLFEGLRSIQLHNFMLLCSHYSDQGEGLTPIEWLAKQPPSYLYNKLRNVFSSQRKIFNKGVDHIFHTGHEQSSLLTGSDAVTAKAVDADWFEWRAARGFITRFDDNFLSAIWQSLASARLLVFGDSESDGFIIDCELVRSSMTSQEESFAQLLDQVTQRLHPSYYKSAVVEALLAFTQFSEMHEDVYFAEPIEFSRVLENAANHWERMYPSEHPQGRRVDTLLQQTPQDLQRAVMLALEELAGIETHTPDPDQLQVS
ncbi:glycoside hydrolase family 15 protein [Gilvimarinus sp. SDUM040013]|uniref:Glycoside hydrolase family 15 protein n=1 Tax=Gilvimarinus gilvus TaxID=3058038 RepID=A0ABU4S253_9GAMM|nr:glycoside hydrolase family 15 protein [Gilvimarinus sp. SDUM040013]MDO3385671.1 glycoside hydrolase family 15 protein [Gilvimarinus sp. SDUM040013]MDX6849309.1 glycoside hydrolase family 15 protein [Gilvimarinus sp. SDUM040013]